MSKIIEMFNEILIFVAGATPQIITETIYALAHAKPPVYPDEIYIITTETGKKRIDETIIKKQILHLMSQELGMPPVSLTDDSFVIVRDMGGNPLNDIRSKEENEAMGDVITSFIREKTKDMNARLHCSLAGGRKTMSFYMGAALQLYGRHWDKLYHVLVSPEFESNPEFFYKPKKNRVIECKMPDGKIKKLNTKDAKIELAELPFIRLGSKISLHGKGFRELVAESQKEIDTATMQPQLMVNLAERILYIGNKPIEMLPVELMVYTAFLKQKTLHCKYPERQYCLDCSECFQTLVDFSSRHATEEMAKDYMKIYDGHSFKSEEFLNKWSNGIDTGVIRQNISKINRTLKEQLQDDTLLPYYSVAAIKKYGSSRYGVRVEKDKIKIE
ncbi:CRISPR-associated ring nuclease Csm6 [Dissulfurispira thermophila]|uniref:CRISPR-associated ring nuclease Csm6 n=1 Tax=Dissulfurispira thermophila TaxID=2715679 RepID=UPI00193D2E33|nr:CRISPR-associated ring nuclease Csm6 [Dissulfurispira thermophila]